MSSITSAVTTGIVDGIVGVSSDGILSNPVGMAIVSLNVSHVGDDGGWEVIASGSFPTWVGIEISVVVPHHEAPGYLRVPTYSGVQGAGTVCFSQDSVTLKFTVPPLPVAPPYSYTPTPFNPFALYARTTDGLLEVTSSPILTVVHRDYASALYQIRSNLPPPYDVGYYSIDSEDYGG